MAKKRVRTRYFIVQDGVVFEQELKKKTRWVCCDCGLAHDVCFALEDNGKLGVAMKRNARATGQIRRKRGTRR